MEHLFIHLDFQFNPQSSPDRSSCWSSCSFRWQIDSSRHSGKFQTRDNFQQTCHQCQGTSSARFHR